jgi:hypothetical integral membrane protein (TIGR02206 family)
MSAIQIAFLVLTFTLPPVLASAGRRSVRPAFDRTVRLTLGFTLLLLECLNLAGKRLDGTFTLRQALPMQLCDWALFASAFALLFRSQIAFDLAYFWGLAGTAQALFTPAVGADLNPWRVAGFFAIHSGIVIAVLYLLMARTFRPRIRSLLHVFIGSEIYLAIALLVNRSFDGNYGFLSAKPLTRTMLSLLSDDHWIYIMQLNGLAFFFFGFLYAPWWIWDGVDARRR